MDTPVTSETLQSWSIYRPPTCSRRGCWSKIRIISAEESGPLGSVYEPGMLSPDQA